MFETARHSIDSLYLWAGQPFHGFSPSVLTAIVVIYFIAFLARGVLGFGAVAPIVIITSLLIDPHHAVLLALVAGTVPQLQMLPEGLRDGDKAIARPVLAAMMVGLPAGVWVFANMGTDWFMLVLGSVIFVLTLLDMGRVLERALADVNLRALPIALGLSATAGFVNGLAGAGGVISIAVYLKQACTGYVSLRATLVLVGTVLLCWRLVVTVAAGLVSWRLLWEALLLLPVVYVGVWLGTHYFRTMTPARYHRLVQLVILVSAFGLIFKGISRIL
ncbi:MAG: sulfite exporter TauE/SafE family protein [Alphaproteobacteria bacterium]|nr:sulfite exporter TauE/SafE family protein [Alphaproteobacteria bacterium]